MRVLVCPDKFAGTLSANDAANAIADGWRAQAPDDIVTVRPLSDGGPGFLGVLAPATGGRLIDVPTIDPLGRPVAGQLLLVEGGSAGGAGGAGAASGPTVFIESAQACGLQLLGPAERDPRRTTSYGLGVLVAAAVETGAGEIVIGLGGSGTNDAGAGMLAALGAAPLDGAGYALPYGGAALVACASLGGVPRLRRVRLIAATDVDSPLCGPLGASAVYGPQKGASPSDVALLDAALARFAAVLSTLATSPPDLAAQPGAGAAGGLGAAILACGGRRTSGIDLVRTVTGLDQVMDHCDLVITGEGSFDEQSLHGKVIAGVAGAARDRGIPCVVVAGRIEAGRRAAAAAGVTQSHSLVELFGTQAQAMSRPGEGLRRVAARLATQWSR